MHSHPAPNRRWSTLGWLLLASVVLASAQAATPKIAVSKAAWSAKTETLTVTGSLKGGASGTVGLYDSVGNLLENQAADDKSRFKFEISNPDKTQHLCSVALKAGDVKATKAVSKAPHPRCGRPPLCKIIKPASGTVVNVNEPVDFIAELPLKGKASKKLKMEWDFAGGAMGIAQPNDAIDQYQRAESNKATVKFVRNNSRYRVRFSARDNTIAGIEGFQKRCEDSVEIVVGTPPEAPAGVANLVSSSQAATPQPQMDSNGNPQGVKGSLVVLPYENLTLQCGQDARMGPDGMVSDEFRYPAINAVAYRKDLKSPVVSDLKLRYSAASSASDPVGTGSINSTSQNWPLGPSIHTAIAPLMDPATTIRKTDRWNKANLESDGTSLEYFLFWMGGGAPGPLAVDQGFTDLESPAVKDTEHGLRMPGYDDPYNVNTPQDFSGFIDPGSPTVFDSERGLYGYDPAGVYQARWLPLTDVDDQGQVNPFPLLRVQAFERPEGSDTYATEPSATVDAVQTSGRDFHCRGCHAKNKIGADPTVTRTAAAYQWRVWDNDANVFGLGQGHEGHHGGTGGDATPPDFFDSPSDDVFDQEYTAIKNAMFLHQFLDQGQRADGIYIDYNWGPGVSFPCGSYCHIDNNVPRMVGAGGVWRYIPADGDADQPFPLPATEGYRNYETNYSMNMHKWHGLLQFNDAKDGILREDSGVPKRWNPAQHVGQTNTRSLFPVKDQAGNPLPMEQNCLQCHAGEREQCYRDRMYTAGVTCYQCHGDMLAVGKVYPKKQPNSDGHKMRQDWMDQPDCGSCHVGTANLGKRNNEFFSAGVRKLAFEADDPSATTRPVDHGNVDAARFAVPATPVELSLWDFYNNDQYYGTDIAKWRVDGPLYRLGKDSHGNVPCGACHGGAHAVWPNRDPNANDNQTALQLQGHTGTILECNVCHDDQAFKDKANLDGGIYMTSLLPNSGVLGGPHNMHPINDPYWYRDSQNPEDTNHASDKSDGTTYGGWHNNIAQTPGAAGEDQCAACHGNDHKGTRLSRTPVDRVFNFSAFDFAKLKKAGFKKNVIKVAAGQFIGCNTCHSIKTSCRNSPADNLCGKDSDTTTPGSTSTPVFTAGIEKDLGDVIVDAPLPYTYTPEVSGGDGVYTFGLSSRMGTMTVDKATGQVSIPDWSDIIVGMVGNGGSGMLPKSYRFVVTVQDGKGAYASQTVKLNLRCSEGQVWAWNATDGKAYCAANNTQPTLTIPDLSLNAPAQVGVVFKTTITSLDPDRHGGIQQAFYTLGDGAPAGVTIGHQNGNIFWSPETAGDYTFNINVGDHAGGSDSKPLTIHVCDAGKTWFAGVCSQNQSPTIMSSFVPAGSPPNPYPGTGSGIAYSFTVTATDPDNDTPSFALSGAPEGMTIDANSGVIHWTPTAEQGGGFINVFSFTVVALDGKGGIATQFLDTFLVCASGTMWDPFSPDLCVPVSP